MVMGNHQPLRGAAKKEFTAHVAELQRKHNFHQTKLMSQAPRYYLASGTWERRKAIFKISLRPASEDTLTNEKLARETLFLQHLGEAKSPLVSAVPEVFAGDSRPHAWYIREWTAGTAQAVRTNEVKFTKSFFTTPHLNWLSTQLETLQAITARDLPQSLNELLYQPQAPSYLWQFIEPYRDQIDAFTETPGITARCKKIFMRSTPLFRNAPRVLAHQELYPAHFVRTSKGMKIIDWENIGWALPTYDYVAIWLRAYEHPDWQHQLYQRYRKQWQSYHDAERLWYTTVFIQSVFNVVGYHYYPDKKKFHSLAEYCVGHIHGHLSHQRI